MKNKWIFIAPIYAIGLAFGLYAITTKFETTFGKACLLLSIVCFVVYYYKRINYIKAKRNSAK